MASPFVAGVSVLVREAMQLAGYESIDQDRIEAHLRETADRCDDPASEQTYLRMNVRRAIDDLLAEGHAGSDSSEQSIFVHGRALHVSGTSDVNTIQVDLRTQLRVAVNGDVYEFARSSLDRLLVQGSGSFSTAVIHGTAGDETVTGRPDEFQISGGGVHIVVRDVQQVAFHAGGGTDVAHLSDSAGGDRFYAHADRSVLSGVGYRQEVVGFDRVFASATAGGHDEAHFYDSSHNDRFYARPDHWTMSGRGYQNRGSGFDRVQAHATLGGDDQAILYDTAGDDRFHSRVTEASLGSAVRQTRVHGFDRVTAHAVSGGQDHAYFHDSPSADRFEAHPTQATMSGLGYYHRARGFDLYHAQSAGSLDSAELYGSFAEDHLTSGADSVALQGPGYAISVDRFEIVRAAGGGGNDRATLSDVRVDDLTYGLEHATWSQNGVGSRSISDFAVIMLATGRGEADLVALQYVFREAGR
jgi:hypothetical protein